MQQLLEIARTSELEFAGHALKLPENRPANRTINWVPACIWQNSKRQTGRLKSLEWTCRHEEARVDSREWTKRH